MERNRKVISYDEALEAGCTFGRDFISSRGRHNIAIICILWTRMPINICIGWSCMEVSHNITEALNHCTG